MGKDIRMLDYVDGFAVHKDVHSVLIRDSDPSLVPLVSIMIPTEVVAIDNDNAPEMSVSKLRRRGV